MRKITYLSATLLLSLLFMTCSKDDDPQPAADKTVEIAFGIENYAKDLTLGTRVAMDVPGSIDETKVENLYLFLFDDTGANPIKYYLPNTTASIVSFSSITTGAAPGSFDKAAQKISLDMNQTEAGTRQVYLIANIDNDIKNALEGVTTVAGLQEVFRTTVSPWSTSIASPILMAGNKTHDFTANRVLGVSPSEPLLLIRAVAKMELKVKLTSQFQVVPTIHEGNLQEYRYRYVDFDTRTYVVKPDTKPANVVSSSDDAWDDTDRSKTDSWFRWEASLNVGTLTDTGAGYKRGDGTNKVTELSLITYLNERDQAGAYIEIELPRMDEGPLPPPEFGPELYRLPLPRAIQRNHWYVYDIEI